MSVFSNPAYHGHERVLFCHDKSTNLNAIIAVHSTALGPAAGGTRLWSYATVDDALTDVLRLSQGMSFKNAMADLAFGGGKAVILRDENFKGDEALYESFGEFVDSFGGDYITAEDVGISVDDMAVVSRKTRYVAGLPRQGDKAGGDPSPKTAYGVFKGIEAAVHHKLNKSSVKGLCVAVQGIGHVGYELCRFLSEAGATLKVADINTERVAAAVKDFSAEAVSLEAILFEEADVLAPCALGSVLNEQSIAELQVPLVAGAANNQLATETDGERLRARGILYAPDYVINAGGIINVASEYYANESEAEVWEKVAAIGERLTTIFNASDEQGLPTNLIADKLAQQIIDDAAK